MFLIFRLYSLGIHSQVSLCLFQLVMAGIFVRRIDIENLIVIDINIVFHFDILLYQHFLNI